MRVMLFWVLLAALAIAMIILGFQGRIGSALATMFTPGDVVDVGSHQ